MKSYINPTSDTYDNLLMAYKFINEILFGGTLPICLITLQREKKTYGYFCGARFNNDHDPAKTTDEIALNPQYFRGNGRDDRQVVSTLVHEMCHLWQHHYGKPGRVRYHNQEWADKMKAIGLLPSSTGQEGGKETGDHMSHYIDKLGPFAMAFDDLKGKGFNLQWIEIQEHNPVSLPPLKPLIDNTNSSTGNKSFDNDEYNSTEDNTPMETPKPDKSNRLKYTCTGCMLNAWAKPGANLVCGDCEQPMSYSL
jgi:hypothetical protein